jgi:hypothetical protein
VGFLWVVGGAVLVALACVALLPGAMARWDARGARRVLAEASGLGAAAGALAAALVAALGAGEPSSAPTSASRLLGLVAASVAGAAIAAISAALARVADPRAADLADERRDPR